MSNVTNLQIYVCICLFTQVININIKECMSHIFTSRQLRHFKQVQKHLNPWNKCVPASVSDLSKKPVHSADLVNEHIHTPRGHTNTPVYPRQVQEHTLLKACPCSTLGTSLCLSTGTSRQVFSFDGGNIWDIWDCRKKRHQLEDKLSGSSVHMPNTTCII